MFVTTLLCVVGVPALCGLAVCFCAYLFRRLCGRGVGYAAVIATSVIGTPVHELGHAAMCLLFGHRIESIRLWNPKNDDGRLGFVDHSYNPKNPYACLGNFFIGIGPLVSGGAAVLLLLRFAFPDTYSAYLSAATAVSAASEGADVAEFLRTVFDLAAGMYQSSPVAWYWRVGAIVLMFSVCLHVSLSPDDLRGSVRSLPWLFVVTAAFSGVCTFLGIPVLTAVCGALVRFACLTVSLFLLVLIFAVLLDGAALVIFLLRLLFGDHSPDGM